MNVSSFKESLALDAPPEELSELLKSLWYAGKGNWEASHDIAQEIKTPDGSWVHGYLHRVEGDLWNARYWYERAQQKMPTIDLQEEWLAIVSDLLRRSSLA